MQGTIFLSHNRYRFVNNEKIVKKAIKKIIAQLFFWVISYEKIDLLDIMLW